MKVRKPYTITKQRERWAEEEHQRFLEALRLYGRAWKRIEEHIGTKTAVQIRSHAQKFFTKIERDTSAGRLPAQPALVDLDIPPPRPKRKPTHPYPRKAGAVVNGRPPVEREAFLRPQADVSWEGSPLSLTARTPTPTPTSGEVLTLAPPATCSPGTVVKLFGQTLVAPTPLRPAPQPPCRMSPDSPNHTHTHTHAHTRRNGLSPSLLHLRQIPESGASEVITDPTRSRRASAAGRLVASVALSDASHLESGLSSQEWEEAVSQFHRRRPHFEPPPPAPPPPMNYYGYSQAQYADALEAEAAASAQLPMMPAALYRQQAEFATRLGGGGGGGGFSRLVRPPAGDLGSAACMAARLGPPGEGEEAAAMAAASAWWALRRAVPPTAPISLGLRSSPEDEEQDGGRAARAARLKELKTRQTAASANAMDAVGASLAPPLPSEKEGEGEAVGRKRPRSQSMSGSNLGTQAPPPSLAAAGRPLSSSGSEEAGREGEGEGEGEEGEGEGGPSSNSSGIGSPQGVNGGDGGSSDGDAPAGGEKEGRPDLEEQKGEAEAVGREGDGVGVEEGSRPSKLTVVEGGETRKEVSSGGRLAFQALFSRATLPRSFMFS